MSERVLFLVLLVAGLLLGFGGSDQAAAQPAEGEVKEMGTDPRDFAPKFMPYYRHTELTNGLEQNEIVLFGLMALSPKVAFTYELPLGYSRDILATDLCAGLPDQPCAGVLPGGTAVLPNGLPAEGDGKELGIGDGNVRFFARLGTALGIDWMAGTEIDLPLATDPALGSETLIIAPMLTAIKDLSFWPAPGAFLAAMNFYAFDAWKDAGRAKVRQYRGRWFLMFPLHPSGIYALPEMQPIYDFEGKEFMFWIGPEFGKMLSPGQILYAKPGWGVDALANSGERDWTFELGFRWFLK